MAAAIITMIIDQVIGVFFLAITFAAIGPGDEVERQRPNVDAASACVPMVLRPRHNTRSHSARRAVPRAPAGAGMSAEW